MITKEGTTALTVAQPGRLRDGLNSLLAVAPHITRVEYADDGPTALEILEQSPTALVLLDTSPLENGTYVTLKEIKARWPHTSCIVLANNVHEQQLARHAGADAALLRGFPVTKLFAIVERLLRKRNAEEREII